MKIITKLKKYKLITTTLVLILATLIGIVTYNASVNNAISLIQIPVVKESVAAGTIITSENITTIEVPNSDLLQKAAKQSDDIIGKVTLNGLAKGSLFYSEYLAEKEEVNNVSFFDLKEGEIAISLNIGLETSYANSILPEQYIDLHFSGTGVETSESKEKVIYGELVQQVKVLAIYDKEGNSIFKEDAGDSSILVVALSYEDADLVGRAKAFGDIIPVVSYDSLNKISPTSDFYDMGKMKDAIYQRTIDIQLHPNTNGVGHE